MSLDACSKCTHLFDRPATTAPGPAVCNRCHAFTELLAVADALVQWRNAIAAETTVGAAVLGAADHLERLCDRAEAAASRARAP